MMIFQKCLIIAIFVALVSSCQSVGSNPAKSIEGVWTSQIGGFPLTVEYAAGQVHIEGHADIPYTIEKNSLVIAGVTRLVSFPSRDEMIQTDPLTNTDQKFVSTNAD